MLREKEELAGSGGDRRVSARKWTETPSRFDDQKEGRGAAVFRGEKIKPSKKNKKQSPLFFFKTREKDNPDREGGYPSKEAV